MGGGERGCEEKGRKEDDLWRKWNEMKVVDMSDGEKSTNGPLTERVEGGQLGDGL